MNSTLINDFGKKIGGARKDTPISICLYIHI